jgi:hypothetical protein
MLINLFTMSEIEDMFVKQGYWTNWSRGPVMGAKITTNAVTANILIVVLTILVTIAVNQLWSLFTFLYHQLRARGAPSDGLFWQQQALLRTFPTPASLMTDSVKLWWSWRRITEMTFLRSMFPIGIASLFLAGSIATSIFATSIVSTSDLEALVRSPYCGRYNPSKATDEAENTRVSLILPIIQTYARDCYHNHNRTSRCHNTFIKPSISFKVDVAECPWAASMCPAHNGPILSMDSGLLDESYFGFNVERHNNVRFRKRSVCNVLPFQNRLQVRNFTELELGGFGVGRNTLPQESFWVSEIGNGESNSGTIGLHAFASQFSSNISDSSST